MAERQLTVKLIGDAKGAVNAFGQVEKKAGGLGKTLGDVGKIAGGFLAANVIGAGFDAFKGFIGGSVEAASSLGESLNAVQQVFGDSAEKILGWGDNAANSFGLSQRAFNEMATPMGAQLKNLGFSQDDVADKTVNLAKRAADMASVFNTDVSDALAAINSALRGEGNPIERYGVSVNQTAVNLRALADTGKESADALTENEKASARLALIFEQTNDVAGDFINTSDGLANSARIQAAQTEEQQALIGEKLIPVMLEWNKAKLAAVTVISEKLVPALTVLSGWISEHVIPVVQRFEAFLREHVIPVLQSDVIPAVMSLAKDALGALVTTLQRDVQPKVEMLVGFMRDHVLPVVVSVADAIDGPLVAAFKSATKFLGEHKEIIGAAVAAYLTYQAITLAVTVAQGAVAFATGIWTAAQWALNAALTANPIGLVITAIAALVAVGIILYKNWDTITAAVSRAWDWFKNKMAPAVDAVRWAVDRLIAPLRTAIALIDKVVNSPVGAAVNRGIDALGRIPGFDSGGIVPGPVGAPRLAVVHGGETILPTHRTGGGGAGTTININVTAGVGDPVAIGQGVADYLVRAYRANGALLPAGLVQS